MVVERVGRTGVVVTGSVGSDVVGDDVGGVPVGSDVVGDGSDGDAVPSHRQIDVSPPPAIPVAMVFKRRTPL